MVDGDSIILTNKKLGLQALTAGQGALALGNGKINLELITTSTGQITGMAFTNQLRNDFGTGSSITVSRSTAGTTTGYTYGVSMSGQSSMEASGLNMVVSSTSGTGSIGIDSSFNGPSSDNAIDLGDNSKINVYSANGYAIGIRMLLGGELVANALEIVVKSEDQNSSHASASALVLYGNKADLGASSKLIVESTNIANKSDVVNLRGDSELIADRLTIEGTNVRGIAIYGSGTVDLGSDSSITTVGREGHGFHVSASSGNTANISANRLRISTEGYLSHGLNLGQGTRNVDLGRGSVITTDGQYSIGIKQFSDNNAVFTADDLTVISKGQDSHAVLIDTGSATIGDGSLLASEQGSALIVGNNATASATNSQLTSGGSNVVEVRGTATLDNSVIIIDPIGSSAYGVWSNGGLVNADGLTVNATKNGAYGLAATNAGIIRLNGDIAIATQAGTAIWSSGLNSMVVGNGKMTVNGKLYAENSGNLNLTMTSGSYFNGSANIDTAGYLYLNMDDSLWQFDSDSTVSQLMLSNDSQVMFNTTGDGLLTTGVLSGSGLFKMRTDIGALTGDLMDVTMNTYGNHKVQVANNGGSSTDGTELLTIITTADGGGNFALTNEVEAGGYLYDLRQTGNDWELYSTGRVTRAADTSASFLNAGYLMGYAENQTLLQRMGDLRQGSDNGNVWVRTYYGNFDSFSSGKLDDFYMTYRGFQLGADKAFETDKGQFYSGAFVGLVDSDQRYTQGDGSLKSKSIGIYGSYMFNSGAYIDTVLRYHHHSNKLNVADSLGNGVSGKGSSNGFSASIESGHRFFLQEEKSGVYVEPQLQLTYSRQGRTTMNNSNGLQVKLDSYDSLLGRAGVLLGFEVNESGKTPTSFYFKNSWLHEFNGDTGYALNNAKEKHTFKGGAWVSGVGVSTQLNNKHVVYLDMEKTTGKKFEQNQINVGYRYNF